MNLRTFIHRIRNFMDPHEPIVTVAISRENLIHNLNIYKNQYPSLRFAPVLKSNAYGHGLITVAEQLDRHDIAFFAVDSYFEARSLRHAGIRSRIVLIGYVRPQEIVSNHLLNIDFGIVDLEQLRQVAQLATAYVRLHIKIDTGMHRHGIHPTDLPEAIELLKSNPCLKVIGAFSHFADADNPDRTHSFAQIAVWNNAIAEIEKTFPLEERHIAATKGIPMSAQANANVARLGIGLYGFDTSPGGSAPLKPVMELRSIISSIREIPPGDSVGYNATYVAKELRRIATVPVGYFEGIDRRLSNKGSFLVDGVACPIVGRVSMNMTSIDVTNASSAKPEDTVVAISRNPENPNSVSNIAQLLDSEKYTESVYVVLTHIPAHLRRVVE